MKLFILLIIAAAAIVGTVFFQAPFAQDADYHHFADTLTIFGIPNFYNVVSNGLLLLVGLLGLLGSVRMNIMHVHIKLRRQFGVLFTAAILAALGSAWYHLAPDNTSLVWDRLPMAILFTGFLGLVFGIYISDFYGRLLFWPLLLAGVSSVLYWYKTEQLGMGDLRFYALTQYLSVLLVILILILYHRAGKPTILLGLSLLMYALAKAAEHFDAMTYHYTGIISGHSLKHVFAGLALFMIYLIMRKRHA